jgi:hypothetical protein
MAMTNPSDSYRSDDSKGRSTMSSAPAPAHRSKVLWVVVGVIVLAAIAVAAYFLLYSGGGGYSGGTGGTGGSGSTGGGGGYFFVALSATQARRFLNLIRRR